jgi:hypothetical protein
MITLLKQHWPGEVSVEPSSERAEALAINLLRPRPDLCPYGDDNFRQVERRGRSYRRCTNDGAHAGRNRWNASISEVLSRAGLSGRKHIPAAYLRASYAQRLALLQGLMDTDGSWNEQRQRAVFVTTTPELAHGLRELVYSLAGTTSLFTRPYQASADRASSTGSSSALRTSTPSCCRARRCRSMCGVPAAQLGIPRSRVGGGRLPRLSPLLGPHAVRPGGLRSIPCTCAVTRDPHAQHVARPARCSRARRCSR